MDDEEQKKKHKCPICFKRFKLKYGLKRHSYSHTDEKNFSCTVCGKKFKQKAALPRHMQTHTLERTHHCQQCDKSFTRERDLKLHIGVMHTYIRKYQCQKCGKRFNEYSGLYHHLTNDYYTEKVHQGQPKAAANHIGYQIVGQNPGLQGTSAQDGLIPESSSQGRQSSSKDVMEGEKKVKEELDLTQHSKINGDQNSNLQAAQQTTVIVIEDSDEENTTPNSGATSDNVAPLKCWVCGDEPGFKSSLMDQFKPQNMGFRYMCPRCNEHLESANNLSDYFKTYNNILELVKDR